MVRARRPAVQRNRQAAAPRAQGRTGGSGLRRIESADMTGPDHLDADRLSAPGGQPVLVVDAAGWRRPLAPIQAVVIEIGRASWRERGCQYVEISVVAALLKKK